MRLKNLISEVEDFDHLFEINYDESRVTDEKRSFSEIFDEVTLLEKTAHFGVEEYSDFINRKIREYGTPKLDLRIKNARIKLLEAPVKGRKSNAEYNEELKKYHAMRKTPGYIELKQLKELGTYVDNMLTALSTREKGLSGLFKGSEFNGDISDWHEHKHWNKIKNFADMFRDSKFNGDISNWKMDHAEDLSGLFKNGIFDGDISKWKTGNVINFSHMFFGNRHFKGNLSSWDTKSAEEMGHMFTDSIFNGDISRWDLSNVYNFRSMFELSEFNGDISKWDIRHIKNASALFKENVHFDQDLSAWGNKWKSVEDMRCMFEGSVYSHDLSNWDIPNNTKIDNMFKNSAIKNFENKLPHVVRKIAKKISKTADDLNYTMSGLDAAVDDTYKDAKKVAKKAVNKLADTIGGALSTFSFLGNGK